MEFAPQSLPAGLTLHKTLCMMRHRCPTDEQLGRQALSDMYNTQSDADSSRREFLKSSSVVTLMTLMGGGNLLAQTNAPAPASETKPASPKVKVGLIGLGAQGREILTQLSRLPLADIAAICDTYPASLRRAATAAPGAAQLPDYKAMLANKDIKAVIVATPTHQHKEIVIEALKAGKHVYCEAPLAHTIEDAREIAAAAKAASRQVFQSGLQIRSEPQRHFLLPFIRSGALGKFVMARAQWHKKTSWRASSPKPEREKELNWRLDKSLSLGLAGEIGCHAMDQALWFLNMQPVAVTGYGARSFWKDDGREVPDTVQARIEFPEGVFFTYDATLANSFDTQYEMFYGSDAAVMLRDSKAWLFKEADSPLLGWEVYARKEAFHDETGIALVANASKSVNQGDQPGQQQAPVDTSLFFALRNFVRNASDVGAAVEDFIATFGEDADALAEHLGKVHRQPAAGWQEGLQATILAIKTNEAIVTGKRIELAGLL
jgi:predicted dehydrogenase